MGEAPQEYTVQTVLEDGTVTLTEVPGRTYTVKGATDPLTFGSKLRGWVNENGTFGVARPRPAFQGTGPSSTSTADKKFDRRPEHPDNVARMQHTSALSAAPTYIEQMLVAKVVPQPSNKDEYIRLAEGVMTWLESTYPQTPKPVSENGGEPQTAPEPAQAAQDDIPF